MKTRKRACFSRNQIALLEIKTYVEESAQKVRGILTLALPVQC